MFEIEISLEKIFVAVTIIKMYNYHELLGGTLMARTKNENKRSLILQSSKMLFAQKGFFNTSISDIVQDTGLPVGSIYTYFKSKDEIVRVIVEEGWSDLQTRLEQALSSNISPELKLKVLIEQFLPELLNDLELINILLTEAIDYTKIEEKIEDLTNIIFSIIKTISPKRESFRDFTKTSMKAGLVVYFLGVLNAVRISRSTSIGIKVSDIIDFVKITIENSMDIKL